MAFSLKPVTGDDLIGREQLVIEILNTIESSHTGYALYGMRRVGKTSILFEVENRLQKQKDVCVMYLSLWKLIPSTFEQFLKEYFIRVVDMFSVRLGIKLKTRELIKLNAVSIKQSLSDTKLNKEFQEKLTYLLDVWKNKNLNPLELANQIFTLPGKLADTTKILCIIILDEFPELLKFPEGSASIQALRTIYEKQGLVVYCIAGSERRTMDAVALTSTSPLYKQLITKEIYPLRKEDVIKLFEKNLPNITITGSAFNLIFEYTRGLPYFVNLIGIIIENAVKGKKGYELDKEELEKLILKYLEREGSLYYTEEFEKLSDLEKYILSVMAIFGARTLKEIIDFTKKPNTTIATTVYRLVKKKTLLKVNGNIIIKDPMLQQWIKYEYKGFE